MKKDDSKIHTYFDNVRDELKSMQSEIEKLIEDNLKNDINEDFNPFHFNNDFKRLYKELNDITVELKKTYKEKVDDRLNERKLPIANWKAQGHLYRNYDLELKRIRGLEESLRPKITDEINSEFNKIP